MGRCSGCHGCQDASLVRPALQCGYSLMRPLTYPNIVHMNILMSSFLVVPCCAQLACKHNLSTLNLRMLIFDPECAHL